VLAQVAGYALSKLMGVKLIAEFQPAKRAGAIFKLIGLSWVALLLFAVVPAPWNVFAMFLNGLPLGMIWGLVFGFMEGRRTSEVLGAILCASFIVSSGAVKSVGKLLMDVWHVSPFWMPAATGLIFFPLLAVSVWGLSILPPPSAADETARVRRAPMDAAARASFLSRYGTGLALLVISYVMTTAIRDFRDNFAAELWTALGFGREAAVYTASELPVAVLALTVLGVIIVVRDNVRALSRRSAIPVGVDDLERRRFVHGLCAVQRYAVRSPDRRQRHRRHSRVSDLYRRCLGLPGQLCLVGVAQFRAGAAQLAAGFHRGCLCHQHSWICAGNSFGGVFLCQAAPGTRAFEHRHSSPCDLIMVINQRVA
jgi:Family of unknown function (DUF5690)